MSNIDILKRLINEHLIIPTEADNNGCYILLPENCSDYNLIIKNPPLDTLAIKCDNFPVTASFFKGTNMECKRADYILFSDEKNVALIIELKRSKKSANKTEITAQLKGARCIIDYCKSVVASFLGYRDFLDGYSFRYYIYIARTEKHAFYTNKQTLINDTPENALLIKDKVVHFRKLL